MGKNTGISWTNHSFNPWMGCARVSPACGGAKGVGGANSALALASCVRDAAACAARGWP